MLSAKHLVNRQHSISISSGLISFSGTAYILWWRVECIHRVEIDACFPFGEGSNPPSICFMLSAIFMLLLIWGLTDLFMLSHYTRKILSGIQFLGSHSLYIFLYHRLFIDWVLPHVLIHNLWCRRIFYFVVMIGGSIALEFILKLIINKVEWSYAPIRQRTYEKTDS